MRRGYRFHSPPTHQKMRAFRYAFLLSYPPVLKHVLKFYLGKEQVLNQYFDSKADEHGSAEKFGL